MVAPGTDDRSRCRRFAGFFAGALAALSLACAEEATEATQAGSEEPPASRLAPDRPEPTFPPPHPSARWVERYYEGRLAADMGGDLEEARRAFREVVAAAGVEKPELAARAALELAEIEADAGRRRHAIELLARAEAIGGHDPSVRERADRILLRLESLRGQDGEVLGPAPGTAISGLSAEATERFARAEKLLVTYHRRRLEPRLEELRASIRAKQGAMDAAVRAYRQVIALEDPRASVAAEFRIGSLLSDLSVSLMFDLPPELEPEVRTSLQRSLRTRAIADLKRARDHYRRCLELARAGPEDPEADRWRVAAEVGLRTVEDLLRSRE